MANKVLYFDCFSGISGDMTIGALLALGSDFKALEEGIRSLGLEDEVRLTMRRVNRTGITATKFDVELPGSNHTHSHHQHRSYKDIVGMIEASRLPQGAKRRSLAIFEKIAEAEGFIHGVPVPDVHFHEVGAVDSIVDVVGASLLIDALSPDIICASSVTLGSGRVTTMHGVYPVPAPATLEILKGAPVEAGEVDAELATPTGAAILAACVDRWGSLPAMEISAIGYGAGTRELPTRPNVLRVAFGTAVEDETQSAHSGHHHHEH